MTMILCGKTEVKIVEKDDAFAIAERKNGKWIIVPVEFLGNNKYEYVEKKWA